MNVKLLKPIKEIELDDEDLKELVVAYLIKLCKWPEGAYLSGTNLCTTVDIYDEDDLDTFNAEEVIIRPLTELDYALHTIFSEMFLK